MFVFFIVELTRTREGQVSLTKGAKQLKAFSGLGVVEKMLFLKWLGTIVDKLFPYEDSLKEEEEMGGQQQQVNPGR